MARKILVGLLLASSVLLSPLALADEPSLHQVYQAAEAGKLSEAQTMMQQVLSAYPNSAKAHYVEAELLVRQGQAQKAQAELATAERLAPGLPFATAQSVENLKSQLGVSRAVGSSEVQRLQLPSASHEATFPWGLLLTGLGLVVFIVFVVRLMAQRNQVPAYGGAVNGLSRGPAPGPVPYGAAYGATPYGPAAAQEPGLGSRLMGGLATGAAVGAGVVAGEALMHHFMDGKSDTSRHNAIDLGQNDVQPSYTPDLGGTDFGVSDASSWDDASGGNDSDWN